jgi:hypothetical protein
MIFKMLLSCNDLARVHATGSSGGLRFHALMLSCSNSCSPHLLLYRFRTLSTALSMPLPRYHDGESLKS